VAEWRLGTQAELCECWECHDDHCHTHPWIAYSPTDRYLCKLLGHKPSNRPTERVVTCARRCGYVLVVPLPEARVIKEKPHA